MSCRCATCIYRASDDPHKKNRPGCSYLLLTGRSRLAKVYKRLTVNRITDKVREAMRPEKCRLYKKGDKLILPDEGQILLPGSIPIYKRINKEQVRELYRMGLNDREIADELGCAHETVRRWRQNEGLPHNYKHGAKPQERILSLYEAGKTDKEICCELGLSVGYLCKWRWRRGLSPNPPPEKKLREERIRMLQEGHSVREIAEREGVSQDAIYKWLRARGLCGGDGTKEMPDGAV